MMIEIQILCHELGVLPWNPSFTILIGNGFSYFYYYLNGKIYHGVTGHGVYKIDLLSFGNSNVIY